MTHQDLLKALELAVNEAITEGRYGEDPALSVYIELALIEIEHKRHCFPNPLHEPVFWRRHFIPWVKDAVEEKRETSKAFQDAVLSAAGKGA